MTSRRLRPQWKRFEADYLDLPLCPHPDDDEFDSGTMNPAWSFLAEAGGTWNNVDPIEVDATFNSGGARWALPGMTMGRASHFRVQPQAGPVPGTAQVSIQKAITWPGNAFVSARMSFMHRLASQPVNDAVIGLAIYQGSGYQNGVNIALNKGNSAAIQVQAVRHIAGVATTIGGTSGDEDTRGQSFHTVGIQKIETDYHVMAMAGEGNWFWLGNITWNGSPDNVSIYFFNTSSLAPGNMIMSVDYIRFSRTGRRT